MVRLVVDSAPHEETTGRPKVRLQSDRLCELHLLAPYLQPAECSSEALPGILTKGPTDLVDRSSVDCLRTRLTQQPPHLSVSSTSCP